MNIIQFNELSDILYNNSSKHLLNSSNSSIINFELKNEINQKLLALLSKFNTDIFAVTNPNFCLSHCSKAFYNLVNTDFYGKSIKNILFNHPKAEDYFENVIYNSKVQIFINNKLVNAQLQIETFDQKLLWLFKLTETENDCLNNCDVHKKQIAKHSIFLNTLLNTIPSPLYVKNINGKYLSCNLSFASELGIDKDNIAGKSIFDIAPPDYANYETVKDRQVIGFGGIQQYESRIKFTDNAMHDIVNYRAAVKKENGEVEGIIGIMLDITERKIQEKRLQHAYDKLELMARTDPLTKLSNRRDMNKKMEYERIRCERSGKTFGLIICDIDNFKKFNDNFGHDCGDFILKKLAELLKSFIRKQDTVCRWGGEEFLLLLPETDIKGAYLLAESLRRQISDYDFSYMGNLHKLTLSFGVSVYSKIKSISGVIKEADVALYDAKNTGKNKVVIGY